MELREASRWRIPPLRQTTGGDTCAVVECMIEIRNQGIVIKQVGGDCGQSCTTLEYRLETRHFGIVSKQVRWDRGQIYTGSKEI
jgi:hypothetical protein